MEYEKLLSSCKYAELRIVSGNECRIGIKDDELRHSTGSYQGASVRVLEGGSWGFASSSSGEEVSSLIARARKLATLNPGKIEVAIPPEVQKEVADDGASPDGEEQLRMLSELAGDMKGGPVSSRNLSCSDTTIRKEFHNSHGSRIVQESRYSFLACSCIAKDGTNIQRGSGRSASRKGFSGLRLHESGLEAREKAIRMLKAQAPPKGRFTVVLDPEMTGVFAHEALGHACEADSVLERESILADRMGKRIGNELVSVVDDPTADDFGRYAYDDEGVAGKGRAVRVHKLGRDLARAQAHIQRPCPGRSVLRDAYRAHEQHIFPARELED